MTDDPGETASQPPEGSPPDQAEEPPVSTRVRVALILAVIVFAVLPALVMWYLLSQNGGYDTLLDEIGKQLSAIGNRL